MAITPLATFPDTTTKLNGKRFNQETEFRFYQKTKHPFLTGWTAGLQDDILQHLKAAPYDSPKALSANLRELRKSLGLTQEGFAERIGMKYKNYQDLEAGRKNNLQLKTLDRIAKDLCVSPVALITKNTDETAWSGYIHSEPLQMLKAAEDAPKNRSNSEPDSLK